MAKRLLLRSLALLGEGIPSSVPHEPGPSLHDCLPGVHPGPLAHFLNQVKPMARPVDSTAAAAKIESMSPHNPRTITARRSSSLS